MAGKITVVLTTEGTYPYYTGGVSTWADILIKQLSHIDFRILAIMMHPYLTLKYDLPSNVLNLTNVPLWGTDEPAEFITGLKFSEFYIHKRKSHAPVLTEFHNNVETIIRAVYSTRYDLAQIGNSIVTMHDIFQQYDYRDLFRSPQLWDFFYDLFLELHETTPTFNLSEFTGPFDVNALCRRIEEEGYDAEIEERARTVEWLNGLLDRPQFASLWRARYPAIALDDLLRQRMEDTQDDRSVNFEDLPPRRRSEIRRLNRLILERTYPDLCPKIADKIAVPPTIYDVVESLRWFYRFFISILAPITEADIYHSSAAAFCGLPCIIAKLKHGTPFLLTEHGIYVREQYLFASRQQMPVYSKEFLMGLISLISRLNYHFADQISPVCAHNKRWEVRFGAAEEKIHVIYNGIDAERFRRISVDRDQRPTVVMVARIDPLKDIETFIQVCFEVKKRIGNVLFKLYGPASDKKYFNRCVELCQELGLNGSFVFAGETPTPEIANNEGDVVVLTSISEAFPFAVIEGMACEKVVISSDVGGTKEVLEGYGFVVRPKDPVAFADQIVYALENPRQMAEVGVEARLRIVSGYRIADMVKNYGMTYERIASHQ